MQGLLRMGTAMALTSLLLTPPATAVPARTVTVRFAADAPAERIHDALAVTGVITVAQPGPGTYVIQGRKRQTAEQLATLFAAVPIVAATDPIAPYHPEDSYQPLYLQDQALPSDTPGLPTGLSPGRLLGAMPLGARDVAVHFHPGTPETAQIRFGQVFAAATVRRIGRYALIVRPQGPASAAARAYRLVPIVRQAEPHHGR